jgi:hypothetical protein
LGAKPLGRRKVGQFDQSRSGGGRHARNILRHRIPEQLLSPGPA